MSEKRAKEVAALAVSTERARPGEVKSLLGIEDCTIDLSAITRCGCAVLRRLQACARMAVWGDRGFLGGQAPPENRSVVIVAAS